MQSEQINELMGALNRAQLSMKPASKDKVNPFFHSKYADLATVWEALAPFREQGIVLTQSPMESPDGYVILDTQLSHTLSGQWIRSRLKMRLAKEDPQGVGSAITYARRYALGCMTGIVTEEDDDGNAASPQPTMARAYTASKQTAQAKIAELRNEGQDGVDSSVGGVAPPPHHQPGSDAPVSSTWRVPNVAWTKEMGGKMAAELTDEQVRFFVQYYEGKIAKEPNSRYRGEWDEALRALVDEAMAREQASPALL
jgi:hypothetical protein